MYRRDIDKVCPACLGPGRCHSLVAENKYRLIICARCRTQYFRYDPELADEDGVVNSAYWEPYKFELYGDPSIQAAFEDRYESILTAAERHGQTIKSVLDVGCGVGNFVDFAQRYGLRAIGCDVESAAVSEAVRRGLTAFSSNELEASVADLSVDAVSLWDVVEHLSDPLNVMRPVLAKLRPGGSVLIETPDGGFPVRSILLGLQKMSGNAINLCGPMYYYEHKVYFTERGIRTLLDRLGIDIVAVRRATSVREKLAAEFEHNRDGSLLGVLLTIGWPAMERITRLFGGGNKLLVIGVKRSDMKGS